MKVKGSTFFVSILLLLCGLAVGSAQQLDIDRELEEAKALYREAKFAQAIAKLDRVVGRLEQLRDLPARRIQLSDAHLHLALSYVALNDPTAAKESLKQMLRADRNRKLDPDVYAPKVIELFEEARAEVAKEPPPTAAVPAPASSPQAAVAKKGGSKAPLIALGVGAAAGGVALAAGGGGGGSSASASPTPTPTPTPTLSGSDDIALITVAPPTGSTISASQGPPLFTMTFSVVYSRDLPNGDLHVSLYRDDGTLCSVPAFVETFALLAGRAQTVSVRGNDPNFPRCALPSTTTIVIVQLYPCPSAVPCSCCAPGVLIRRTFNVRYTFIP